MSYRVAVVGATGAVGSQAENASTDGTEHTGICQACHGEPHDAPMHKRFPDCHKCHGNPHNLKKK